MIETVRADELRPGDVMSTNGARVESAVLCEARAEATGKVTLLKSRGRRRMAIKRYVREAEGGWEVVEAGQQRSVVRADTREKALAQARAIVRSAGGGEVRVVNRVGKIVAVEKINKTRKSG